jgi:hypothetical protein
MAMSGRHYKFYQPKIIWFGVWMAIFMAIWQIGSWQNRLYWQDTESKFSVLEFLTAQKIVPYAIAYLEQQGRPDLLQKMIDADLGPYALVVTDGAGKIKFASHSLPSGKMDQDLLKGKNFFSIYQDPAARLTLAGPYAEGKDSGAAGAPPGKGVPWGRLYLVAKEPYSFATTLQQAYGKIVPPMDSVYSFTVLSYFMVLVGFAAICAISAKFQSHFQDVQERQYESELETRELRIEVLESNIKSVELRLQLLDRSQEKAQTVLNAAKNTIAALESAIHYESSRNEELREQLDKAEAEKEEAIAAIQAIEQDREKIARELKELEALREVEEMNYPEGSRERARRPREFLWLNMVYGNLCFSRRALQNIIDLQNSPDIFPSLPDALASLNHSTVESLRQGGAIPSRSVVRFTQPLPHHDGDFWEYRFSKDGRIFFGLSQSKTWNIDTILLKRKFSLNRYKYEKHLEQTLGKDNDDLQSAATHNSMESQG